MVNENFKKIDYLQIKQFKKLRLSKKPKNPLSKRNPALASQWDYSKNISLTPDLISFRSVFPVWWKCPKCNYSWKASPDRRTTSSGITNCPNCSPLCTSFPEQAIFYYISQFFPDAINRDRSNGFELDIYIPSRKIGIEYDGSFFHNNTERDNIKHKKCKELNIFLIRIKEKESKSSADKIFVREDFSSIDSLTKVIEELLDFLGFDHVFSIELDLPKILGSWNILEQSRSLASVVPESIDWWDYEKNYPLTPEGVPFGFGKKVWWKCPTCGSSKYRTPNHFSTGDRCRTCKTNFVQKRSNPIVCVEKNMLFISSGVAIKTFPYLTSSNGSDSYKRERIREAILENKRAYGDLWRYATEEESKVLYDNEFSTFLLSEYLPLGECKYDLNSPSNCIWNWCIMNGKKEKLELLLTSCSEELLKTTNFNNSSPLNIKCEKGHPISMAPRDFLVYSRSCPTCRNQHTIGKERFRKGNTTFVIDTCDFCNNNFAIPSHRLLKFYNSVCPTCRNKLKQKFFANDDLKILVCGIKLLGEIAWKNSDLAQKKSSPDSVGKEISRTVAKGTMPKYGNWRYATEEEKHKLVKSGKDVLYF